KFLVEAPHAAIPFVPDAMDAGPGSVTLPSHMSKGPIQDKFLARLGALKDRRNRLQDSGIPADEIDRDIDVLQSQLRCVDGGITSDETLADHLSELDRQRVRRSTPLAELQPGELAPPRSNPPATRPKKPALPPKRRDFSRYFDAVKLTPTQRDYL